jgi:hypothetical protein
LLLSSVALHFLRPQEAVAAKEAAWEAQSVRLHPAVQLLAWQELVLKHQAQHPRCILQVRSLWDTS